MNRRLVLNVVAMAALGVIAGVLGGPEAILALMGGLVLGGALAWATSG